MSANAFEIAEQEEAIDDDMAARIREAEAAIAGLADNFRAWAFEDVQKLDGFLAAADQAGEEQRMDLWQEVFDVAHNLKGQGASFNFVLVTEIADLLCGLVRRRLFVDDEALAYARRHVDAIRVVLENNIQGDGGDDGRELLSTLQNVE